MRVGVVTSMRFAAQGGGYQAQDSLLPAIAAAPGAHEFILLNLPPAAQPADEPSAPDGISRKLKAIVPRFVRKAARSVWPAPPVPAPPTLEECIREAKVDIVWFLSHAHEQIDAPYITTVWDLLQRRYPVFMEDSWERRDAAFRYIVPRATRVISGTQSGKADIVAMYGVDPDNVVVIPLSVHPSIAGAPRVDVRKKYGIVGDYIFYPSHFWRVKNHINLLLALDRVRRNGLPQMKLVLAGSDKGNREYVASFAKQLGFLQDVHILDFVAQEELGSLYREAVALVYPSFNGPDNLPPLEAFSVGCPVAAAKLRGADEGMEDAALWFDPANVDEIADAILKIATDQDLRARLICRGHEVASQRSPRQYVAQVVAMLDGLEPIFRCWSRGNGSR